MTRIYSYDRLDRIYTALYELRVMHNGYFGDLPINRQGPGNTLTSLNDRLGRWPILRDLYLRLLKEDAKLAQRGEHTNYVIQTAPYVCRDAAEWAAGLKVVAKSDVGDYPKYGLRERTIALLSGKVQEILEQAFPSLEFEVTEPGGGGWDRYGRVRYRFKPELIPDVPWRSSIPSQDWQATEYGPVYDGISDYTDYAHAHAGNGRMVPVPDEDGERMSFIGTNLFPSRTIEEYVQQGQAQHRENILRKLRGWRVNQEAEAEFARKRDEHRAKTQTNFEHFRSKLGTGTTTEMLIPTLPFVEIGKGIKSSRRWGIEIETGAGRCLRGIPDQWDSKGDGSLESAYGYHYVDPADCTNDHREWIQEWNSETRTYDEVENPDFVDEYDCYSCGDQDGDYDDDDCVEVVSPILNSMHSKGLRQLCEDLEHSPRTDSAGIHVHVEAKDLSVRQVKELVMGYDHIERFIESSYDRRERGYCKRRSARELLEVVRQPEENIEPRSMLTGDRYVTVNLMSLYSHGTIEFRAMGPKYNYDHLIRWAMFCREMVNSIANGATSKDFARAKSWADVTAIFTRFGVEYKFATMKEMEAEYADQFEDIEETV